MTKQYFLAIIEVDTDLLGTVPGAYIAERMTALKTLVQKCGSCEYYQVTDAKALNKFRNEIKRRNP